MLKFRKAEKKDLLQYFVWANDNTVRSNAINSDEIAIEDHTSWFLKKTEDRNTLMLVFTEEETPAGQLRIDIDEKLNQGLIDYSVDKSFRGKGFGTYILKEGFKYFSIIHPGLILVGLVKQNNHASAKAFTSAGFKKDKAPVIINEEEYIKFWKK